MIKRAIILTGIIMGTFLTVLPFTFAYGDTVTEDSSGTIWVKGTDGTTTYCYTIGEGPTKKVICHER